MNDLNIDRLYDEEADRWDEFTTVPILVSDLLLSEDGYEPCTPHQNEFTEIDQDFAENNPCPICKDKMSFEPRTLFEVSDPNRHISYRAFAVCRSCVYEIEF